MCKILNPFKGKNQVVGYKVALRHNGKFYSPSSGVEYKVGKIDVPAQNTPAPCGWCSQAHNPSNRHYNPKFVGLTAVVDLLSAKSILGDYQDSADSHDSAVLAGTAFEIDLCIIKIRLGGVKYVGEFWQHKTWIGSIIREVSLYSK